MAEDRVDILDYSTSEWVQTLHTRADTAYKLAIQAFHSGLNQDFSSLCRILPENGQLLWSENQWNGLLYSWLAEKLTPEVRLARYQAAELYPYFTKDATKALDILNADNQEEHTKRLAVLKAIDVRVPLIPALSLAYGLPIPAVQGMAGVESLPHPALKSLRNAAQAGLTPSSWPAARPGRPPLAQQWESFITRVECLRLWSVDPGHDDDIYGNCYIMPYIYITQLPVLGVSFADALAKESPWWLGDNAPDLEALHGVRDMVYDVIRRLIMPLVLDIVDDMDANATPILLSLVFGTPTVLTLARHSEQWHVQRGRIAAALGGGISGVSWPALIPACELSGVDIIPLLDSAALNTESEMMDHCVASMAIDCIRGKTHIFALRTKDGHRLSTLSLQCKYRGDTVEVEFSEIQHLGLSNAKPPEEACRTVTMFLALMETQPSIVMLERCLDAAQVVNADNDMAMALSLSAGYNVKYHAMRDKIIVQDILSHPTSKDYPGSGVEWSATSAPISGVLFPFLAEGSAAIRLAAVSLRQSLPSTRIPSPGQGQAVSLFEVAP